MKNKKVVIGLLIFVISFSLYLTACAVDPKPLENKRESDKEVNIVEQKELKDIWTDKENLIKIWKEGDDYLLYYNLNSWEKVHDIYNYTKEKYPEASLKDTTLLITGLTENIKDVAIVSIETYGGSDHVRNDFPVVFMLMESGRINWFRTYPPVDWILDGEEINVVDEEYVGDYLPYLKDIEYLSYESDGNRVEELTLFAIDKKGLKYDIRHAIDLEGLAFNQYTAFPARDYGGKYKLITIDLSIDGEAKLVKTLDKGESLSYQGSYQLVDKSLSNYRAPIISLNMKLEAGESQLYAEKDTFVGDFLLEVDYEDVGFYHLKGDFLEEGIEQLEFQLGVYEIEDWYPN